MGTGDVDGVSNCFKQENGFSISICANVDSPSSQAPRALDSIGVSMLQRWGTRFIHNHVCSLLFLGYI